MPKPGQKTITVTQHAYDVAEEKAKAEGKSVARFVTDCINRKRKAKPQ